jgi:hypothetical protein
MKHGALLGARKSTAGPEIHKMQAALLQAPLTADRVTPIRVAAVDHDVAFVQMRL